GVGADHRRRTGGAGRRARHPGPRTAHLHRHPGGRAGQPDRGRRAGGRGAAGRHRGAVPRRDRAGRRARGWPTRRGGGPLMRAASRAADAGALERLDQLAAGAEPERLRTVADELLAAADLLRRQPRLRRALADPAQPGSKRSALLAGLLAGRIGDWSAELLRTLVSGRWSAASELLDGCEQLGVQALLASAEASGDLADVEDELFRFGQVVSGDPVLAAALGDRSTPAAQRAELTELLLAGKASEVTRAAVRVALGGFGGRGVGAALIRLVELAAERRDRSIA